jgi:hypothetical protein
MLLTLREIKGLKSVKKLYFEQKLEKVGKKLKKAVKLYFFKIWEMA